MSELAGKVVVVTGAGRGIGRGIARAAAAQGAKIVVADYGGGLHGGPPSSQAADAVASDIAVAGGEAVATAHSVATMDGARATVDAALERWGRVDGLVCCAGIVRHRPFLELSERDFDEVVVTHLKGHFAMFQTVLAAMVERGNGGSLIGIGSGFGQGDPSRAPYRAAKAGVVGLTKSVALAGAEHGVRANVISPMANTRMTESSGLHLDSEPEDIAPMAIYLLSDRSKHVNGELFSVAGRTIKSWADPHERKASQHHACWTAADIDKIMPWLLEDSRTNGRAMPPLPEAARREQ
jgi:NAD(P)-dependent dehydrogenase (short-subunit alcohol dehydrogenase family)